MERSEPELVLELVQLSAGMWVRVWELSQVPVSEQGSVLWWVLSLVLMLVLGLVLSLALLQALSLALLQVLSLVVVRALS